MAKKISYENMLNDLNIILDKLEKNELTLEDSMKEYEKGVKLINKLYKTLDTLEGKLTIVKDGKEVEFDKNDEY